MKLFIAGKMPDPREPEFRDAMARGAPSFHRDERRAGLRAVYQLQADARGGGGNGGVLRQKRLGFPRAGGRRAAIDDARGFKATSSRCCSARTAFWEGVDVPGRGCKSHHHAAAICRAGSSLVEAKIEAIEARDGNPFMEFSLPVAVLKFRQGVGRLIRTKSDEGILLCSTAAC
ncbi:MAG: hypothetical protein CM1200mP34_3540 [Verrucomicrobiales bacterium]|nr:MAG: hypothetical protein CM1200mP34_3540 [Verrucomicrobiales bacterium]